MTNFTRVFQPIPSWLNWPIVFKGPDLKNIIDWQTLFTWLWRWLPLRLSKRQSGRPTRVRFRTTLTRTITHCTNYWYSWVQTIYYLLHNNLVPRVFSTLRKVERGPWERGWSHKCEPCTRLTHGREPCTQHNHSARARTQTARPEACALTMKSSRHRWTRSGRLYVGRWNERVRAKGVMQ